MWYFAPSSIARDPHPNAMGGGVAPTCYQLNGPENAGLRHVLDVECCQRGARTLWDDI